MVTATSPSYKISSRVLNPRDWKFRSHNERERERNESELGSNKNEGLRVRQQVIYLSLTISAREGEESHIAQHQVS